MEKFYVGVDVGGTSIKMGMFSHTGELLEKWEIPTRVDEDEQTDRILPDIAASIEEKRSEKNGNIVGIGLGIPGPVTDDGTVLKCANIHWPVFNVKEKLFDLTGVANIRVGNDANVAALGEMWKGGGRGFDSIVMVTLGTGVGGGIIVDGRIVAGANGAGGEIGHMNVCEDEEEACNCGQHGCLEQYASATGVVRMAKRKLAKISEETSLHKYDDLTAKDVFDVAKAGDKVALEIVNEVCEILGKTLGKIACVVNPEVFVIGGGVSKAGQILIDTVKKYYVPNTFTSCKDARFELASLGNDAGMYGCMCLMLD